jgi:hypothetical protein
VASTGRTTRTIRTRGSDHDHDHDGADVAGRAG